MKDSTNLVKPRELRLYDPLTGTVHLRSSGVVRYSRPACPRNAIPPRAIPAKHAAPARAVTTVKPAATPTSQAATVKAPAKAAVPTKAASKLLEYGPLAAAVAQNEKALARNRRRYLA